MAQLHQEGQRLLGAGQVKRRPYVSSRALRRALGAIPMLRVCASNCAACSLLKAQSQQGWLDAMSCSSGVTRPEICWTSSCADMTVKQLTYTTLRSQRCIKLHAAPLTAASCCACWCRRPRFDRGKFGSQSTSGQGGWDQHGMPSLLQPQSLANAAVGLIAVGAHASAVLLL